MGDKWFVGLLQQFKGRHSTSVDWQIAGHQAKHISSNTDADQGGVY